MGATLSYQFMGYHEQAVDRQLRKKMADQKWSHFYVVFNKILCELKLQQMSITLLFEVK